LGEDFRFKPTRWLDCAAGLVPAAYWKIRARWEGRMLGKVRITAIAAATLLASPAFAGWPADQAAQLDLVGGQRIIREIVADSHLIEADSDDASANELRPVPNWIDVSGDSRSSASTLILR